METYLVGGAVRDELLDLPVRERDWVVVGASPEQLLGQGYQQVGRDFPVFLHPETREEYALARTERKRGHGYTGFEVHCDPSVTLEQDLRRRDLTVNAMARDREGRLVDPWGGRDDLRRRLLRHVSEAFVEDPLRVLRTARFAARFAPLGFTVAPETMALMAQIARDGELAYLPAERIWTELERALGSDSPGVFIQVLRDCGALARLLPEVDALFGVPQPAAHHPEVDTGAHLLLALAQAAALSDSTEVRFAVLVHDLGKGATPEQEWPRHIAHEHRGAAMVERLCRRIKAPNRYRELALAVCRYHTHCHRALELRGRTLLKLLQGVDALRRPERLEPFLLACEADARGRGGLQDRPYPQADHLRRALAAAAAVSAAQFQGQGLTGRRLGEAIHAERVRLLEELACAPGGGGAGGG